MGGVNAHTRYIIEIQGKMVILQPETDRAKQPKPFWETATPEERAQAFIEWASSNKSGPGNGLNGWERIERMGTDGNG